MRRALVSVLLHREVPASRLAEFLTEADGDEDSGEDRLAPVHDLDPPAGHGRRAYPARKAAARVGRAEWRSSSPISPSPRRPRPSRPPARDRRPPARPKRIKRGPGPRDGRTLRLWPATLPPRPARNKRVVRHDHQRPSHRPPVLLIQPGPGG